MGFRFKKSVKIAPGVKMNIGKRGVSSLSAGGFNFGKRGVYHNVNIPGTGISYRTKFAGKSKPRPTKTHTQKTKKEIAVVFKLHDDGSVVFVDKKGKPLPDLLVREAKKQNREIIESWLYEQAENYNGEVKALVTLHVNTPTPEGEIIVNPRPEKPNFKKHGLSSKLFGKLRTNVEEKNEALQQEHDEAMKNWELAEEALRSDPEVMSAVLSDALTSIDWPRETLVSFDIVDNGRKVLLDVDLPEIEDMPSQEATVNKSKLFLTIKDITQKQQRLNYLNHIHAIGFRFIGDVFAYLPFISEVVFSGFSQRIDKKTGHIEDEYLYSVRVARDRWRKMNFGNLGNIDLVECFEQFEIRRKVTTTGVISPIEPFEF